MVKAAVIKANAVKREPVTNATPTAEPDAFLEGVKTAFKSVQNRDIQLSDEVLKSVLDRAGEKFTEMDDEDKIKFLLHAEATAKQVSVSDPGITTLVKKLDADFHTEVAAIIAAKVKDKTSAVDIYAQFRRIYTREEMNAMPMPGSDADDVKGTNFKADKVKKKATNGEIITVVWSNDFVAAWSEGKEYEDTLALIKKETDNPGSTRLKSLSKQGLAALKSDVTAKRNALRSVAKRAIKLHHQFEAVGGMPLVNIEWIPAMKDNAILIPVKFGEGKLGEVTAVTKAPKPLWISPKGAPSQGRDFSVTQLLSFSPSLALLGENNGNMADLIGTAGKGGDDPDSGDAEGGDGEDMADDVALATYSQIYNFFNKKENMAAVLKKIVNRAKDAEGNDWLELLCGFDHIIHPQAQKHFAAYNEMLQRRRDEQAAELEKKQAAQG